MNRRKYMHALHRRYRYDGKKLKVKIRLKANSLTEILIKLFW